MLDRLKKAYKKADVKLGGYLPGGKTPKQVKAEKAKPKKPVSKAPKEFTGDKVIDVARVKHEPDKTVIIQPGTPDIRIKVPETKRETEDLKRAQRAATIPKSRITKGFESVEERLSGFREVPSEEGIGEAAIKTAPRFAAGFAGWFAAEGAKKSRSVEITLAELRRGRSFKEASRTALAEVPISTIKKEDIAAYNPFQEGISPGERLQRTSEAVFILGGAYRSTKGRITPAAEKASPKFRPDVRVIVPTSKGKVVSVVDGKRVVDVPYSYSIRTPSQRLLGSEGKFGAGAVRIATKEGKAKFVGADIAEGRYVYGREAGFQLGKFDPSVSLGASRTSTLGQGVKLSDIVGAGAPVKRKLKVRAKRTTPDRKSVV